MIVAPLLALSRKTYMKSQIGFSNQKKDMGVFVHLLLRNPRTDEQKLKQRNRTILSIYDNLIADNITLLFLILFYITVTLPGRKSDTVTSQGRMPGTRRVVVQFPFRRLQKRRRRAPYPSLSFHFRNKHFVKLF